MSLTAHSPIPPPSAAPWTRAITGCGSAVIVCIMRLHCAKSCSIFGKLSLTTPSGLTIDLVQQGVLQGGELAGLVRILGFGAEGGGPAAGWTAYPPLSTIKSAAPGSLSGGKFLLGNASTLAGVVHVGQQVLVQGNNVTNHTTAAAAAVLTCRPGLSDSSRNNRASAGVSRW